jgi:hypothetical protein
MYTKTDKEGDDGGTGRKDSVTLHARGLGLPRETTRHRSVAVEAIPGPRRLTLSFHAGDSGRNAAHFPRFMRFNRSYFFSRS